LVHLLLLLLALGHWTILALDVANFKAFRSDRVCVVQSIHPAVNAGALVYTTCYDLLVFVLSIVKLSRQPSKSPLNEHLRAQGLLYFAVATMANVLPMVFAFLGSDGMVDITGVFWVTASAIVSCRAVRSLLGLRMPRPSVENDTVLTTQLIEQDSTNISVGASSC